MPRSLSLASAMILVCLGSADVMAQASTDAIVAGAWSERETRPILDKTLRVRLPFAAAALDPSERAAVTELIAAGERLHDLYLAQRHPEALAAKSALAAHPERPDLAELFRLMSGPVATTLDNRRAAFLAVAPETPARNVYPAGATRDAIDAYLDSHPERRDELMDSRSVVAAATPANARRALAALDAHPVLDVLHPGLRERIARADSYLAIPYSVAYADDLLYVYGRLNAAAAHLEATDPAFAKFLRQRGRDLLADDYDGSDATWVTADFTGNLNAEIGSYETYDDPLYGVRTFFGLSLLERDAARSAELAAAIGDIQEIEDALPYAAHKKVSSRIPVGVYNVIADFGQARGANTATILPNESHLSRQYGRTILIRGNVLMHSDLFALRDGGFDAATVAAQHADLDPEGPFYRTLWHEVGHYLGVDRTADGRDLDAALQDTADLLEEMKADLVSLFAARLLHARGFHDDARLRSIYADGIQRVLQKNRPRREQPYQTMQLIQWNWFLDRSLLTVEGGRLRIHYDRYPEAVDSLLAAVLDLQRGGDRGAANAFVDRWTRWDESLHGVIAKRMRDAETTRFVLVHYAALGE
jgi:hypothetical protein